MTDDRVEIETTAYEGTHGDDEAAVAPYPATLTAEWVGGRLIVAVTDVCDAAVAALTLEQAAEFVFELTWAIEQRPEVITSSSEGWTVTGYDDGTVSVECCVPTLGNDAAIGLAERIYELGEPPTETPSAAIDWPTVVIGNPFKDGDDYVVKGYDGKPRCRKHRWVCLVTRHSVHLHGPGYVCAQCMREYLADSAVIQTGAK